MLGLRIRHRVMAAEMVHVATSDKLKEMDWEKNIEICELVTRHQGQAKDVIKSIKKQLRNKNATTQLYAVMLLEMLMNNCGEHIHRQVIDNGLLPILVKIVKKKTDLPVRERIFLLLDATQTALGASGTYPQYYAAYYDLVSARVQFPQHSHVPQPEPPINSYIDTRAQEPLQQNGGVTEKLPTAQILSDPSIIQKATSVLEVLRDVLAAMDPKRPAGATDEFVLDLVEQCSFQKQRVMHLVVSSRDEKMVTQAIELNEQLQKVLAKHDALLSARAGATTPSLVNDEGEEEEDVERLYRRICKGKACADDYSNGCFRSIPDDSIRRTLNRPLCIQSSSDSDSKSPPQPAAASIPPLPAQHVEREKFFKEKHGDGTSMSGHMRGLSLHSCTGSSSLGGSADFSDQDFIGF